MSLTFEKPHTLEQDLTLRRQERLAGIVETFSQSIIDQIVSQNQQEVSQNDSLESVKSHLAKVQSIQFVPCGLFEGKNIEQMLQNYIAQTVLPENKTILVFCNGQEDTPDTVSEIITKLQQYNPTHNIFCIKHIWEQPTDFSMGMAREIPVGAIKKLWKELGLETNPLIISNDADISYKPDYLENYLKKIGQKQCGSGTCLYESKPSDDDLYRLSTMMYQICRQIQSTNSRAVRGVFEKFVACQGNNSSFRLQTLIENDLCYDVDKMCAEDTDLWQRLIAVVGEENCLSVKNVGVVPDSRRFDSFFASDNMSAFIWDMWKDWNENGGDGSAGREGGSFENKERSLAEIESWFNNCFRSRLLRNYSYQKHESTENFVTRCNSYVRFAEKYIKMIFKKEGVEIPNYKLHPFIFELEDEYGNDKVNPKLENALKNHKFITIEK